MTRTDIAVLLQAIAGDRAAAGRHVDFALAHAADLDDEVEQTVVAASLHHFYAAIESLTERVARGFGQTLPSGSRWHQELLELAALDIPGVRPPLFSAETVVHLRHLLAFRQFFRHAYAVPWDAAELATNVDALKAAHPRVEADLDRFTAALRAALDAPD